MPSKTKTDSLKTKFLNLSSRIQDVYDDIDILNKNRKKPELSYGATYHKLLFLPYFSLQIRQEWIRIYTEGRKKTIKPYKRLSAYNSFLVERLRELDFDISILRNGYYGYIFN